MKKLFVAGCFLSLVGISFYSLWATDKFQTLDKVAADESGITMTLSGITKYHAFKISNPPRIVVEFTNTEFNAKEKEIAGAGGIVKRIRGGQFQNDPVKITRIVVDLAKMVDYQLKHKGNKVRLIFAQKTGNIVAASTQTVVTAPVQAEQTSPEGNSAAKPVVNVSTTTAGTVVPAKLSKSDETSIVVAEPVSEKESKNLNIGGAQSFKNSSDKEKPLIDAKTITQTSAPKDKKFPQPPISQTADASGNQHVIMPKKPITIDFDDADIRDVFRILSMKSGINIIYGNDVTGTISLRLENVPFDKAFQTILSLKNLVSQELGANILRVASPTQISDERAHAVTFTKVFPLNYAKAEDIKQNLDSVRNAEGRKGSISVDERTNSLIITDTPDGLISLQRIITELDSRPVQVLIEAKIVEVTLNNDFDLGIQWQTANTLQNTANSQVGIGQSQAQTQSTAYGAGAAVGATVVSPVPVSGSSSGGGSTGGGTGVLFPAAASASGEIGQIAFGIISNQANISGVLSALAQKSLSKLLSDPKVTTINNKEAKILVGQRIPYTTTTVTTAGSTQSTNFMDVGVKLTVTPTINADQKITLSVHPEVSLYVRADPAGPVIGTREANTTVIVNSGETVVIGGLITENDIKQGEGVPLLQDLPVIGFLFKHTYDSKQRDELLVFLTPEIINN